MHPSYHGHRFQRPVGYRPRRQSGPPAGLIIFGVFLLVVLSSGWFPWWILFFIIPFAISSAKGSMWHGSWYCEDERAFDSPEKRKHSGQPYDDDTIFIDETYDPYYDDKPKRRDDDVTYV